MEEKQCEEIVSCLETLNQVMTTLMVASSSTGLGIAEIRLIICLVSQMDANLTCILSNEAIIELSGLNKTPLRNAKRSLIDKGIIKEVIRPARGSRGWNGPSEYYLVILEELI